MEGSEIGKRIKKYFDLYIKIVILNAAFPTILSLKPETGPAKKHLRIRKMLNSPLM